MSVMIASVSDAFLGGVFAFLFSLLILWITQVHFSTMEIRKYYGGLSLLCAEVKIAIANNDFSISAELCIECGKLAFLAPRTLEYNFIYKRIVNIWRLGKAGDYLKEGGSEKCIEACRELDELAEKLTVDYRPTGKFIALHLWKSHFSKIGLHEENGGSFLS